MEERERSRRLVHRKALDDKSIELRQIKTGIVNGRMIQVLDGVKLGDKLITKGSLFIDRAAASS
mgnify:CR=1 FL=1